MPIDKPDDLNVILGQAHFIKTVEDLHEAFVGTSAASVRHRVLRILGPAPRAPRGNDDELVEWPRATPSRSARPLLPRVRREGSR